MIEQKRSDINVTMEQIANGDWATIERDAVASIRALAAAARAMAKPEHSKELADKMANDLFLPNLKLIAMFCENVNLVQEK